MIKEVEVIKEVPVENPEGLINLNNETTTISRGANKGPLYAYRTNKTLDKNTNEHTD